MPRPLYRLLVAPPRDTHPPLQVVTVSCSKGLLRVYVGETAEVADGEPADAQTPRRPVSLRPRGPELPP